MRVVSNGIAMRQTKNDGYSSPAFRFTLILLALPLTWGQLMLMGVMLPWLASVFGYSLDWTGGQIMAGAAVVTLMSLVGGFLKIFLYLLTGRDALLSNCPYAKEKS